MEPQRRLVTGLWGKSVRLSGQKTVRADRLSCVQQTHRACLPSACVLLLCMPSHQPPVAGKYYTAIIMRFSKDGNQAHVAFPEYDEEDTVKVCVAVQALWLMETRT